MNSNQENTNLLTLSECVHVHRPNPLQLWNVPSPLENHEYWENHHCYDEDEELEEISCEEKEFDWSMDCDDESTDDGSSLLSCPEVSPWSTPRNFCPLSRDSQDHWTWNPEDKSQDVHLEGPKGRIAHFHPDRSNGTAAVRGTQALNNGRHYWEIEVSDRIFGTSIMFGVGTRKARVHVNGFVNMLGENDQSWGLSYKGSLWHRGRNLRKRQQQYTKPFKDNVATTVGLYFDGVAGTLTYFKDGVNLGVAFKGLHMVQEPLYPMVCSTAAKTQMSLGVMRREFLSLQDRCRANILKNNLGRDHQFLQQLPKTLRDFVTEDLSSEDNSENDSSDIAATQ